MSADVRCHEDFENREHRYASDAINGDNPFRAYWPMRRLLSESDIGILIYGEFALSSAAASRFRSNRRKIYLQFLKSLRRDVLELHHACARAGAEDLLTLSLRTVQLMIMVEKLRFAALLHSLGNRSAAGIVRRYLDAIEPHFCPPVEPFKAFLPSS